MKYDQITVTQRYSTHLSLGGVKQPDCTNSYATGRVYTHVWQNRHRKNSYATSIYSSLAELADFIAILGQTLAETQRKPGPSYFGEF